MMHYTSKVIAPENISFQADNVTLVSFAASNACYFEGGNGIEIGENFLFAPGVKVISTNHDPENHGVDLEAGPIKIGSNVWLGAGAIILPGVEIADDCTVAAGAVVTKSCLQKNATLVGVPAKVLEK